VALAEFLERNPLVRTWLAAAESPAVVGADETHIGLLHGLSDRPVCNCGARKFQSCDETGAPMATSGEWRETPRSAKTKLLGRRRTFVHWSGLFSCDGCGLIVDGTTREIVRAAR
jgi:hypothetical protein